MSMLRGSAHKASLEIFPVLCDWEREPGGRGETVESNQGFHRQLGDPWENPLRTGVTLPGAYP